MTTPPTRRLAALGVVACAVGALGAWLWWDAANQAQLAGTTENAADTLQSAATGNASAPGAGAGTTRNSRTGAASNAPPLPSTDLPLRATFDQLKRRAERGDPRSSCPLPLGHRHLRSLHHRTLRTADQRTP